MDDAFGSFLVVMLLVFVLTTLFSRDIVDIRTTKIVESVTLTSSGDYRVCFDDGDIRNSCIVVSKNTFQVGDTITFRNLEK